MSLGVQGGLATTGLRALVGVAWGALLVPVDLSILLAGGTAALGAGRRATAWSAWVTGVHLRRLDRWCGDVDPGYRMQRSNRYVLARWPLGVLGGSILLLLLYGLVVAVVWVAGWPQASWALIAAQGFGGLVLAFLAVHGLRGVVSAELALAHRVLGPDRTEQLRQRITTLAASRSDVVAAVDDERRRIERDLHDGVQQRLVALGMLLGRARRATDPARVAELTAAAHEETTAALADLRDVAWRVYPAALDRLGLGEALHRVAESSSIPVTLTITGDDRAGPARVAAYFVVAEAVTNAAKHARASTIEVSVRASATSLDVRVRDDGSGGADPDGSGLVGLARRVAAHDGTFEVSSPPGGPTVVTATLPVGPTT